MQRKSTKQSPAATADDKELHEKVKSFVADNRSSSPRVYMSRYRALLAWAMDLGYTRDDVIVMRRNVVMFGEA